MLILFLDHRENNLETAKALVEDTKTLVAGAASSQEELAGAAQNAVTTIGGNSCATHVHGDINESAKAMTASLQEMQGSMEMHDPNMDVVSSGRSS